MRIKNDIFYDIDKLTSAERIELLHEAKNMSYNWWVDYLDVEISFARQSIEMNFEDILKRINTSTHFVFIHRRGIIGEKPHLEIGFRTMEEKDHFLFIYIEENKKEYFINKYRLKEI
jgi:hypothetical protein